MALSPNLFLGVFGAFIVNLGGIIPYSLGYIFAA